MFLILRGESGKSIVALVRLWFYAYAGMSCCICCWRDDDFVSGLVVCALAELFPDGIDSFFCISCSKSAFSDTLPDITRAGACGGPRFA